MSARPGRITQGHRHRPAAAAHARTTRESRALLRAGHRRSARRSGRWRDVDGGALGVGGTDRPSGVGRGRGRVSAGSGPHAAIPAGLTGRPGRRARSRLPARASSSSSGDPRLGDRSRRARPPGVPVAQAVGDRGRAPATTGPTAGSPSSRRASATLLGGPARARDRDRRRASSSAFASARWATARGILLPLAVAANAVPIIAFAPLMNNWFGVAQPPVQGPDGRGPGLLPGHGQRRPAASSRSSRLRSS